MLHSEGPKLGKYKRDFTAFGNYSRISALPWNVITLSCILACHGEEVSCQFVREWCMVGGLIRSS